MNMSSYNILIAGFGGQGILFAGKVLATAGLLADRHLSWLPSYGPEMRGGTANCSVCISDQPIGSPLVTAPDILMVMNIPSYDKFIDAVVPGGTVVIDSTLVDKKTDREDISAHYIPATMLAKEHDLSGLANIILLGKLMRETGFLPVDQVKEALISSVPARKEHLKALNEQAFLLGFDYD